MLFLQNYVSFVQGNICDNEHIFFHLKNSYFCHPEMNDLHQFCVAAFVSLCDHLHISTAITSSR